MHLNENKIRKIIRHRLLLEQADEGKKVKLKIIQRLRDKIKSMSKEERDDIIAFPGALNTEVDDVAEHVEEIKFEKPVVVKAASIIKSELKALGHADDITSILSNYYEEELEGMPEAELEKPFAGTTITKSAKAPEEDKLEDKPMKGPGGKVASIQKTIDPNAVFTKSDGDWGKNTDKAWGVWAELWKEELLEMGVSESAIDSKKALSVAKSLDANASGLEGVYQFIRKFNAAVDNYKGGFYDKDWQKRYDASLDVVLAGRSEAGTGGIDEPYVKFLMGADTYAVTDGGAVHHRERGNKEWTKLNENRVILEAILLNEENKLQKLVQAIERKKDDQEFKKRTSRFNAHDAIKTIEKAKEKVSDVKDKVKDKVSDVKDKVKIADKAQKSFIEELSTLGVTKENNPLLLAALMATVYKESKFIPQPEINYNKTSPAKIRKIFGLRVKGLTDEQIVSLSKDIEAWWNYIYGDGLAVTVQDGTEIPQSLYNTQSKKKVSFGKAQLGNVNKGDGYKYRGRGLNQLTGRSNYKKYGYEANPDSLNDNPKDAAIVAARFLVNGLKRMLGSSIPRIDTDERAIMYAARANAGTSHAEDSKKIKMAYGNVAKYYSRFAAQLNIDTTAIATENKINTRTNKMKLTETTIRKIVRRKLLLEQASDYPQNKEEGNAFRVWVNDKKTKEEIADLYQDKTDKTLGVSGKHDNIYVTRAWDAFGEEYKKQKEKDETFTLIGRNEAGTGGIDVPFVKFRMGMAGEGGTIYALTDAGDVYTRKEGSGGKNYTKLTESMAKKSRLLREAPAEGSLKDFVAALKKKNADPDFQKRMRRFKISGAAEDAITTGDAQQAEEKIKKGLWAKSINSRVGGLTKANLMQTLGDFVPGDVDGVDFITYFADYFEKRKGKHGTGLAFDLVPIARGASYKILNNVIKMAQNHSTGIGVFDETGPGKGQTWSSSSPKGSGKGSHYHVNAHRFNLEPSGQELIDKHGVTRSNAKHVIGYAGRHINELEDKADELILLFAACILETSNTTIEGKNFPVFNITSGYRTPFSQVRIMIQQAANREKASPGGGRAWLAQYTVGEKFADALEQGTIVSEGKKMKLTEIQIRKLIRKKLMEQAELPEPSPDDFPELEDMPDIQDDISQLIKTNTGKLSKRQKIKFIQKMIGEKPESGKWTKKTDKAWESFLMDTDNVNKLDHAGMPRVKFSEGDLVTNWSEIRGDYPDSLNGFTAFAIVYLIVDKITNSGKPLKRDEISAYKAEILKNTPKAASKKVTKTSASEEDYDTFPKEGRKGKITRNANRLNELDPASKGKLEGFVNALLAAGYDVGINSVYRTQKKQKSLSDKGSKMDVAKPGYSPHNFGLAIDMNISWLNDNGKYVTLMGVAEGRPKYVYSKENWLKHVQGDRVNYKDYNLQWGGDFRKYDPVHFDVYPDLGIGVSKRKKFSVALRKAAGTKDMKYTPVTKLDNYKAITESDSKKAQRILQALIKKLI